MSHWRVTRPSAYSSRTLGYTDANARQGYYSTKTTEREAVDDVRKRHAPMFDRDTLDVQDWSGGALHGKLVATFEPEPDEGDDATPHADDASHTLDGESSPHVPWERS